MGIHCQINLKKKKKIHNKRIRVHIRYRIAIRMRRIDVPPPPPLIRLIEDINITQVLIGHSNLSMIQRNRFLRFHHHIGNFNIFDSVINLKIRNIDYTKTNVLRQIFSLNR